MPFYTGDRIEDGYRNFFLVLALIALVVLLYFYGPPLGDLALAAGKGLLFMTGLLYLALIAAIIRTWWRTRNNKTRKGGVSTN